MWLSLGGSSLLLSGAVALNCLLSLIAFGSLRASCAWLPLVCLSCKSPGEALHTESELQWPAQ